MKKNLLIHLFFIVFAAPSFGMEPKQAIQPANTKSPQASPAKPRIRLTSNFTENYPDLVKTTYENKNLKSFTAEQFVFSQNKAIESMNAATERGANVYLTVGAHGQNKPTQYKTTTFKRDPEIHGKITVGLEQSPSKGPSKKGTLLFGSANTTNMVWKHNPNKPGAQFNFESGIEIKDDMDIITDTYKMIKSQSPMKPKAEKKTIPTTPKKLSLYSSKDTNLNESLALRFNNAAEKGGKAWIRSMTFNDSEIADELSKLGPNAEIIVDDSALTKKGIPLLQKMHDANVSVNIFNPKTGSRAKQHAKDVIIETSDKKTYISSTGNLTNQSDEQRNYQLYVPQNKKLVREAKEDFEKVKKETISLPKALELKKQEQERKRKAKPKKSKAIVTKKQKTQK